ncbi:F-box/FBD/LRR-repeat protein At1g13570-like [Rutidosis leptorrhynchoides]|uniref:F-box/FBD/LRR-repeat protein At1g13570-like n=1 Tax=Rutidosis leptorrhynchoides TaxID=125765 RepID=UPI003A99D265
MMKTQCRSSDRISYLPENIIDTILTRMPIRDALRTSVLSKKWRYCWMTMPKLVFDYKLVRAIYSGGIGQTFDISKFINAVFHVLLIHSGPTILKFDLAVHKLGILNAFDQFLLYVSRRTSVKDLIIMTSNTFYKLPTSFFSLQGLESIGLRHCNFEPPVTFNGFNKLRSVFFENVQISAKEFQHFLLNCPLLEKIALFDYEEEYVEENSFKFAKLFQCVPLIHTLVSSKYYIKFLAAGGMPNKLPTSLHLKYVYLDVCLREQDVISSALCIIRSSPNLEQLCFLMYDNEKLPVQESSIKFDDLQDDLSLTLDHLKHFEIVSFSNYVSEMEFLKLMLAKSPVLKIARIELKDKVSIGGELKILRDMNYLPRASPSAKLIIECRKHCSRVLRFW